MKKQSINIKTMLAALAVLSITSCADEELVQMPVGKTGQLHIASVSVGDNTVASRADEGETTPTVSPGYNEVVTEVSSLTLKYSFVENSETLDKTATANKSGDIWTITTASDGSTLQPSGDGEKWENLSIEATNITGNGYATTMPTDMEIASWDGIAGARIYQDKVFAKIGGTTTTGTPDAGGIIVDKSPTSATLGQMKINLKHVNALLHLNTGDNTTYVVSGGTYVKDGVAYTVDVQQPLLTLWAVMTVENTTIHVPLTKVIENNVNNLQAIVPVGSLTGFKAVMNVGDEAELVLNLKVSDNIALTAHTQYELSLNITPNNQSITFQRNDKPGWGADVTLQQSVEKNLKYANEQFVVSSAKGLQELNKWMTGTGGDDVKYIEGYGDVDQTVSRLSHDIHIEETIKLSEADKIYDLDGDGTLESNWMPLGTKEEPYTGTITAADDASITGLEIHVNEPQKGFVGYLGEDGKVNGLKLQGNFSTTSSNFGAVVGYNNGGTVDGCETLEGSKVDGNAEENVNNTYIGGIVGWNHTGLITGCVNRAVVTASGCKMVGGVLGENHRNDNCVITNCSNHGSVKGQENVGGVVGINHRVMKDCHNTGGVTGEKYVGGVVGQSNDAAPNNSTGPGWPIYVINCTNTGTVSGSNGVGGVVGTHGSGTTAGGYIIACWNSGEISVPSGDIQMQAESEKYFGGVVGINHAIKAYENLSEYEQGIAGNRTSFVIACYNTGGLPSGDTTIKVGGVVGLNTKVADSDARAYVYACYWYVDGITSGCGGEQNTGDTGSDYNKISDGDWSNAITTMNDAIENYKEGETGGYGKVECPSANWAENITTDVKTFVSGTNSPQLSDSGNVTGN